MAKQSDIDYIQATTGSTPALAAKYADALLYAMDYYNINSDAQKTAFLSQVGEESDHLRTSKEYGTGANYEGRKDLGNIYAGDGVRFKGRGLIQITGRVNYKKASDALGIDFISNPSLMEQPNNAALVSAWFWALKGLNDIASKIDLSLPAMSADTSAVITKITRVINGGTNGLAERKSNFASGLSYLTNLAKDAATATENAVASTTTTVANAFSNADGGNNLNNKKNNIHLIVAVIIGIGLGIGLVKSKIIEIK